MSNTVIRDYRHAAKVFGTNSKNLGIASDFKHYRLSPKYGFLFYVEFDFNPMISNVSNTAAQELGMIVKNVNLPKFTIDTKVHNAYNRVNIVQNKIKYDPVSITFHDDQADNVRNFWYDYYSFFYRDSDYADGTYQIINKYQERPSFNWGYSPRPVGSYNSNNAYQDYQYIQAIRIYSLYQGNFSEYELVNPVITSFRHGEHNTGESTSLLEHQMTVQFETVKYQTGFVTDNNAGGFITLNYDNTPSPLVTAAGEKTSAESNPDQVTDLAYYNLRTAGGAVVPPPNTGAFNASSNFSSLSSILTYSTAASAGNAGGFALPSLGSLTTGITSSNILGQQLQAAAVNLAGSVTSTLAGGVISGLTAGLGPTGTQVVGLAAAAIANPTAALATIENMAINYATGAVNALAQEGAQWLQQEVSGLVSEGLTNLNEAFAFGDFGSTFTESVSGLYDNVSLEVSNFFDSGTVYYD